MPLPETRSPPRRTQYPCRAWSSRSLSSTNRRASQEQGRPGEALLIPRTAHGGRPPHWSSNAIRRRENWSSPARGNTHVEVMAERAKRKFGVELELAPPPRGVPVRRSPGSRTSNTSTRSSPAATASMGTCCCGWSPVAGAKALSSPPRSSAEACRASTSLPWRKASTGQWMRARWRASPLWT